MISNTLSISSDEYRHAQRRALPLVQRLEYKEQGLTLPLQTLLGVYDIVAERTGNHDAAVLIAAKETRRQLPGKATREIFTYPDAPGKLARGLSLSNSTLAGYCEQAAHLARKKLLPSAPERIEIELRAYQLRQPKPEAPSVQPLVGLHDECATLENHLRNLCMYDTATQDNARKHFFPRGITLAGPPGTGKSSLLQHMVHQLGQLSHLAALPHSVATYDSSNLSSYFGRSAKLLRRLVEQVKKPSGIGLLLFEDADMLFQNRDDGQISRGILEVQQYLLGALSGLGTDRGNYIAIFTTNKINHFDEALRSRFGITYTIDPFVREHTHTDFFAVRAPHLSAEEQKMLGNNSYQAKLRGRDLAAVVTAANGSVASVPTNDEIRARKMQSPELLPQFDTYVAAIAARTVALNTCER